VHNPSGPPSWSNLLQVNRGGTGQSSALTPGGVIYAASATAMNDTAAGTTSQVLVGGAAPSWGTVPTGAFAFSSIPYSALQSYAVHFAAPAATYTNNTTTFTTLATGTAIDLPAGITTFTIAPLDTGADFYNVITSGTNNHSVYVSLKYTISGPSGFSKTYLFSQHTATASAAAQVVGSLTLPPVTFVALSTGDYTFTVEARVDTAGDAFQVGNYRLSVYKG